MANAYSAPCCGWRAGIGRSDRQLLRYDVLSEFSAGQVGTEVLTHLERRRATIVHDEQKTRAEVDHALAPIARSYREMDLPLGYFNALAEEIKATLPERWRAVAEPFTTMETRSFDLWRGGDVVARLTYVLLGLILGGLILAAPFIPIWEKWFPFALAFGAWWLPDLQVRWQKRRYARALGEIVKGLQDAQPALDRHITLAELLPPKGDPS